MAQKLSVVIALEGAKEINEQLADLGQTGKKAFEELKAAADKAGGFDQLDPTEVTEKLKDLGITGVQAIDDISDAVQHASKLETIVDGVRQLENSFGALGKIIKPLGGEFRRLTATASALYKAVGPIGLAITGSFVAAGAAIAATTKLTIGFAQSINAVSDEAIKVGLSIEKFDQLRGSLEAAGISGKGISEILQRMGQAADAADLSKVTQAIKELQEASERGFGAVGTTQLQTLEAAAKGVGPAADAARKALVDLGLVRLDPQGVPIIEGLPKTLAQLVGSTGSAEKGLAAFVEQLRQMPPGAQQSKLAVQELGTAAGEIVRAFQTGQITADQFKQQLTGLITPDQAAKAAELGQAINRLESAWTRFGSVTFAPLITAQIDTITQAIQALQNLINNFSWGTFASAATSAGSALGWLTPAGLAAKAMGMAFGEAAPAIQQTGTAAAQAGQQGAQGFQSWEQVLAGVKVKSEEVGTASTQAGAAAAQGAQTATTPWQTFLGVLEQAWNLLKQGLAIPAPGAPAIPGKARGGLLGGRGTGTSDSNLAWLSRGEYVMPAGAVRQPGVLSFLEALRRSGGIPSFAKGGAVGGLEQGLEKLFWGADEALNEMVEDTRVIFDQITTLIEDARFRFRGAAGGFGAARGGLLGGRGTGTSDSNLAWVSRGEHIMPARAVAQPGVLAFLEALRRSGGNLSRVLDGMGRFALGGMVPRAIPAFAAGGLAGGGNHVTIQFPGLPAIGGLRASSDVVDQLHRAAALAQVRSGGRKPSRYS